MGDIAIGIDLGTTNSCVACYRNNTVEVLENADERSLTPSCVFFLDDPTKFPIIGDAAKKMSDVQPSNGIYEIKRFMGKRYNEIKERLNYLSFNVTSDIGGNPVIEIVRNNRVVEKKTPQEISTLILKKLKIDAEAKLGYKVNKAVITVPAYFNSSQRAATMAAAEKAGFEVLQLFNEPTAAALSYYFFITDNENKKYGYSLVYDLGGGTFDVSILKGNSNHIEIIGVDGDTNLGGKDLDSLIIDYVCEQLENNYNFNPKGERRVLRRLQNKCEQAKIELSSAEETTILLEGFVPNIPVASFEISREGFEKRANGLFQRTIEIVSRCLERCKVSKEEINEVILAGGSSRIPKIQETLTKFFGGKILNKTLHIDQCVAEGAALRAAMLCNSPMQEIRKLEMTDVVPLSIGLGDVTNTMSFVIKRNSKLPADGSTTMTTTWDEQEAVQFMLYEGERLDARKNFYLGSLTLENLTKAAAGQCKLTVTLKIDKNGILHIKAEEEFCSNVQELKINYNRKPNSEVYSIIENAEENKEEDKKFAEFAYLKDYLIEYCQKILSNLRVKNLKSKYNDISEWCSSTTTRAIQLNMEDQDKLLQLIDQTEETCKSLLSEHKFEDMPILISDFSNLLLFDF